MTIHKALPQRGPSPAPGGDSHLVDILILSMVGSCKSFPSSHQRPTRSITSSLGQGFKTAVRTPERLTGREQASDMAQQTEGFPLIQNLGFTVLTWRPQKVP